MGLLQTPIVQLFDYPITFYPIARFLLPISGKLKCYYPPIILAIPALIADNQTIQAGPRTLSPGQLLLFDNLKSGFGPRGA